MKNALVTFSLEMRFCDSVDEVDGGEVLITPDLHVYSSAAGAAVDREGLDVVEAIHGYGYLRFFASDGSPLRAEFSKDPHFNDDNPYFPGIYTLQPGAGENLQAALGELIARNRSPQTMKVRSNLGGQIQKR